MESMNDDQFRIVQDKQRRSSPPAPAPSSSLVRICSATSHHMYPLPWKLFSWAPRASDTLLVWGWHAGSLPRVLRPSLVRSASHCRSGRSRFFPVFVQMAPPVDESAHLLVGQLAVFVRTLARGLHHRDRLHPISTHRHTRPRNQQSAK